MGSKILGLMVGFLLIGFNLFAADGDLIVNGNVGIGTTNPGAKLHVARTGANSTGILIDASGADAGGYGALSLYRSNTAGAVTNTWTIGTNISATVNDFEFSNDDATPFKIIKSGAVTNTLVLKAGNVGIGTTEPGYKLHVAGPAYSTGGWQSSDVRFKENVMPIESPLEKILNIKGVTFNWRTEEFKEKGFPEGRRYGVIAQEIEKVLPEVVKEGPGGEKNVSYTEIIPVLIEAMKEQQKTLERQQKEIEELKASVRMLKVSIGKSLTSLQP